MVAARLTAALFIESNPVPVKYALSTMKMMSAGVRLPLVELRDKGKAEVDAVLAHVAEGYADYMIGHTAGHDHRLRFFRAPAKRNLSVVS
jgi:hypothetical protein